MEIQEAIRTKRAVRLFSDQAVPEDLIRQIVDAGRRSQSSKNSQPWRFIVIRQRETLRRLGECGKYAGHLFGAAFGVALVSSDEWAFDLGQSAAYMQLAAWGLGIGSCIASMWEPNKAKAILGIPDGWYFDTAISFGYPAEHPKPAQKSGRKPLEDVMVWEHWPVSPDDH
jgi:nitroreductase